MTMQRVSVSLARIVPSETNPRRDFGDIDALAEAIRATGSQCVNPPITVKDGNTYRVVDGERRLRALQKVWEGSDDAQVDVLVCDSYDAADEAIIMLATDEKKSLTDEERAAGSQRCLLLGVDDERVAHATSTDISTVRKARHMAKRVPEGAQCSLEQLAKASEYTDEELADKILAAKPDEWQRTAMQIDRSIQDEQEYKSIAAHLEANGVKVVDDTYELDGLHRWGYAWSVEDVYELGELPEDTIAVALTSQPGYELFSSQSPVIEDEEKIRMRMVLKHHKDQVAAVNKKLLLHIFGVNPRDSTKDVASEAAWHKAHANLEHLIQQNRPERSAQDNLCKQFANSRVGTFEVADYLQINLSECFLFSDATIWQWEADLWARIYDACVADGYIPDADDTQLRELAGAAHDVESDAL